MRIRIISAEETAILSEPGYGYRWNSGHSQYYRADIFKENYASLKNMESLDMKAALAVLRKYQGIVQRKIPE